RRVPPRSSALPYTTLFRSDFSTGREQRPRDNASEGQLRDLAENDAIALRAGVVRLVLGRCCLISHVLGLAGQLRRKREADDQEQDRKSTRLNSSHVKISYA